MDRREMRPPVLARIPNLNSSRTERSPEEPPTSKGRILSQAISWKLLASVALVLVALAIVPLATKRDAASSEPATVAETWHPSVPAPSADVAPPWSAPIAQTTTAQPATTQSAATPSPIATMMPEPPVNSVTPTSASVDEPLVSAWPNSPQSTNPSPSTSPTQSTWPRTDAVSQDSRVDANQSMAIRPNTRTNY